MASTARLPSEARLDVLDGLRGIAILMVVWWHLWLFSWLTPRLTLFGHDIPIVMVPGTGLMGVELFFFLSGFVLFYPYARHLFEGRPLQTVRQFAHRRFIKIVPSYVIALVAAAILIGEFTTFKDVIRQVVTHLLFIHIFWVDTWVGVNGVLWSLGVEIQFYLIFPALCWLFRRQPMMTYLLMVAIAVGYRLFAAHTDVGNYVLMGQMPAYLDLFADGMLAAWIFVWMRSHLPVERFEWLATLVAVGAAAGLCAMLGAMFTHLYEPNQYAPWQAANRLYWGGLLAVFAVAALFSYRPLHAIIANRFFVFMGVISYNMYLWHNVLMLWMLKHRFPAPSTADPHADERWKWAYTISSLAITFAVSIFVTYAIERPLLKRGFGAIGDLFKRRAPVAEHPPVAVVNDG